MFRKPLHILSATLCLALLAVTATAAPQADPNQEIDLKLDDADLLEVLESFAGIAGGSLDADPGLVGSVTLELNAVPWRQALDELCRINDLSCYWSELDGPELVVRPSAGGFRGSGASISMGLREADLQQTLLTMTAMAGEDFALEVDPALSGTVSLDLRSTPWPLALEDTCRNAGCVVTWGERSARISPPTPEAKVARAAQHRPAELWVDPALTRDVPDLGHRIEGLRAESVRQPAAAFDELCEQVGCTWALHWGATPRLKFEARAEPTEETFRLPRISSLPTFGVHPVAVQVSLDNAVGTIASHDVQFDWGHPARYVGLDSDDGSAWLTLTWLPFTHERQVLLPSVVHCDGEGKARRVSVFDPLTLPLDVPWSDLEGDVGLTIRSIPAAERRPAEQAAATKQFARPACLETSVRLRFEMTNLAEGGASETSTPRTKPGNYLMIRPPAGDGAGDPLAALVYLATTGEIDVVAQVAPGHDGAPATVDKFDVSGDWSLRLRLGDSDEAGFLVEVRGGDGAASP